MSRSMSVIIVACSLLIAAHAQLPQPVELPPAQWTAQSQQMDDGKVSITPESFILTRGAQGSGTYMLRVFQDVPIKAGGLYAFSYEVKVEGSGYSQGIVFSGNAQGAWDEPNARHTEIKRECDFTQVRTIVGATPTTVKFRLDLRASGVSTTITYRNVTLEQIGQQPDTTLSPSDAGITLDGRLDDPIWTDAVRFSPFRVLGEVETLSTVGSEALLAVRGDSLYVGYRLAEPDVAGMKMTPPPDATGVAPVGIYEDDCTETFFSVDRASYSHLIVNAAGARHWDQRNSGRASATWYPTTQVEFHPEWEAKAAIGEGEWTCEMRVKLSDLYGGTVGGDQTLYVNFTRHRPRGAEQNLTYAPVIGEFYAVPREFIPVTLRLPSLTDPAVADAVDAEFTNLLGVPDVLMAGTPVKLVTGTGAFRLPADPSFSQKDLEIDPGVLGTLREALSVGRGGEAEVAIGVGDVSADAALDAGEREKLHSPEAFRLELAPRRATITGRTRDGALRGIATLILMANRARLTPEASLPAMTLYDAPRLPFRGMMIHPARPIVDVAFLLRLNKLVVFLDSFGVPTWFPFESYPIGGKATTKQELVDLFDYARARGIEPIVYFASWGRTQYLKNMPGGVDLLVDDVDVRQKGYRNLDVARPETHTVMLALQQEIIDTLHPESFCIAMDEAHFGNMVTSEAAKAKGWKPSDWFAEALRVNAEFFRPKGIRMFIWGDMIDPGHNGRYMDMCGPELLARLPKDMTIFDWKYDGSREITEPYPSMKMFIAAGLPTIGCPWYAPKGVARLAHNIFAEGGEGLMLTAWNSTSPGGMPTEWIRALSLTAYLGWSPEDCDLGHFTFVPDAIMQGAAYWQRVNSPAGQTRSVPAPDGLTTGAELVTLLGLPAGTDASFITTAFRNARGVGVEVFRHEGVPGAVALQGRDYAVVRNADFSSGLTGWSVAAEGDDTLFEVEDGTLKATRVRGNEFRRVLQNLPLDADRAYTVRYRVRVEGPGNAKVWTYSGDASFRWDEASQVHSRSQEREWTTKEIEIPPKSAALRICLTVDGAGTTAWFDDIEVVEKGVDPATLAPRTASIPVDAAARVVTFMHTASHQPLLVDNMRDNRENFTNVVPGEYRVHYADGTTEVIPLAYRVNVVACNDPNLGRECDIGLFGTLGGSRFMNLPTYTWPNPHPEKTISTIEARSGSSSEMTLLVFGVTLE